ncbi:MAG: ATP-binding protein [Clostridia bacterium]|nr:ATP-binding protein [Clostridia bacterium]
MINYFNQQLQSIYASKRALAKENSQSQNKALLALHPKFEELLKTKKQTELDLVKAKSKGLDVSQLQSALDRTNQDIKQYVQETNLHFTPPYLCLSCKDTGYMDGMPCECLKEQYNALIKENASLTALSKFAFEDNKFGSMDIPQAKGMDKLYSIMQNKVCNDFFGCKWNNFMLSGASGVGKTCLALATANALLDKGVSALYLSAFEFVNIFLDKHTHKQTALSKKADYVSECEMLIIDNFGEEPIYKNVTLEYLFSTLDKRMANNKKTFICTQLGAGALISRYGETFLSKFTDKKYSLSVGYITGENLRKL